MKRFAKLISILVILSVTLSCLSACGGGTGNPGTPTTPSPAPATPSAPTAAATPAQPAPAPAQPAPAPSKPANRLEAILARGYLEVVMEPYFAPNQFIDPSLPTDKNQNVVGSDVEFAKYIAEKLGVECRIIPLEFGAVLAGVTEGKYDMAISGLAYTPAREEAMTLSKGYFFSTKSLGHGLLIHKDNEGKIKGPDDVKGRIVVAQSGSLQELFVNTQLSGYKEFKRVSSTNDAFLSVSEKKADAAVVPIGTASLFIEANPTAGIMVVPDFKFFQDETTLGTRIGMPKGEKELLERVNGIIDEILASGQYVKWYEEYTEYAKKLGV